MSLAPLDLLDLLSRTSNILEAQWMVAADTVAAATDCTVALLDGVDSAGHLLIPTVGATDASRFLGARLRVMSGANQGFSTTITALTSTPAGALATATTLTVADPFPAGLAGPIDAEAGDSGDLLQVTAITQTGQGTQRAWTLLGYLATANTNLLAKAWVAPADGLLTMKIGMAAGNTAATFSVSETNKTVTTTETAGTTIAALNNGIALAPNTWSSFTLPVVGDCLYQIQTSIAQAITWTATWAAQ